MHMTSTAAMANVTAIANSRPFARSSRWFSAAALMSGCPTALGRADQERHAVEERDVRAVKGREQDHERALDPEGREKQTAAGSAASNQGRAPKKLTPAISFGSWVKVVASRGSAARKMPSPNAEMALPLHSKHQFRPMPHPMRHHEFDR